MHISNLTLWQECRKYVHCTRTNLPEIWNEKKRFFTSQNSCIYRYISTIIKNETLTNTYQENISFSFYFCILLILFCFINDLSLKNKCVFKCSICKMNSRNYLSTAADTFQYLLGSSYISHNSFNNYNFSHQYLK